MSDRQLVLEDFADKVGTIFAIAEEDVPAIALTLETAEPLKTSVPSGSRPPFSLTFLSQDTPVLPQRIYRLEHEGLGAVGVFLVPVGKDARGVSYQAVFN